MQTLAVDVSLLNVRSKNGVTPFHTAASGGHVNVLDYLLQRGMRVSVLNVCSKFIYNSNICQKIFICCVNTYIYHRQTPVCSTHETRVAVQLFMLPRRVVTSMCWIGFGSTVCVLQYNCTEYMANWYTNTYTSTADANLLNVRDKDGATVLYIAALRGHVHVMDWLLQRGMCVCTLQYRWCIDSVICTV